MTAAHHPGTPAAWAVDRYLCSYAHLVPDFARHVIAEFTGPSLRAVDLTFGIDLVALIRHATVAVRRTRRLRLILAADLALLLLVAFLLVSGADPATAADTAATTLSPAASLGLVVGVVGLILAPAFVLAYTLDVYRHVLRIDQARGNVRQLAPVLDPRIEQHLTELMGANVLVFREGNPFVGYGLALPRWSLDVDATKPAKDSAGNLKRVIPFTATDILKDLTERIRKSGIAGIRVHNRIFVSGVGTHLVPGLLPDPMDHPVARVRPDAIRQGIERPHPDARTYLCLEKVSWAGELVVNLLVRAEVHAGDLFIEGHAFVLLPIRPELCTVDLIARSQGQGLLWALRQTARTSLGWLVRSPFQLLRIGYYEAMRDRAVDRDRRRIQRGQRLNRGAEIGIRSLIADEERISLFAYVDEEMILNSLRRRVLDGIENFLDRHGIDTTVFTQAQSNIVTNNYSIQQALASSMIIGNNGVLSAPGNNPANPGGGGPGGGTGRPPGNPLPWSSTP